MKKRGSRSRPFGKQLTDGLRVQGRGVWTLNSDSGNTVYGESVRRIDKEEWRRWDPHRSKLGAGLQRTSGNLTEILPDAGSRILYLGAGHGTTVSHLHDLVCGEDNHLGGRILAVDLAPRCLRDLNHLASTRKGLVPLLADARRHNEIAAIMPYRVDWLFQDVAQASQVEIFLAACKRFLKSDGLGLFSLKAASERWDEEGERALFTKVAITLEESGLDLVESIELAGFEEHHMLFVCRRS